MTEDIEIPLASTDKYEEALSKARFEYEKNPCASEGEKRLLEIIFPELRENELERAARDYALKVDMGTCGELVIPAFIAGAKWQEKQDQETIELAEDHAMLAGRMQMKEEMEKIMESDPDAIEKTPKQDYSGLNDFERAIHRGFLCAGVENVPVSIIKQTAEEALKRIPTEWSEEDEKIARQLEFVIKGAEPVTSTRDKLLKWLNSFYSRPHFKTSPYSGVGFDYEGHHFDMHAKHDGEVVVRIDGNFKNSFSIYKSDRESCFPQPHWRPSEESMEALILAIEGNWEAIKPTGYMSRRLEDLYEGLANTFKVECKLEE